VNPKGFQKKATAVAAGRVVAGAVGAVAATMAARGAGMGTGAPEMPKFGRVAYLAVSETDLALVKTKFGWKMTPTEEALAVVPRTEIVSADLDEGKMISHLKIVFSNDVIWQLDVPRTDKKTAQAVVRALDGTFS
jgi:hypothetical protein